MFLNAIRLKKCILKQFIDVAFLFDSIADHYKTQEICDLVVSLYTLLIIYCSDRYITQSMCDKAVDDSSAALKRIPDWFVTSKMIEKLYAAMYADVC